MAGLKKRKSLGLLAIAAALALAAGAALLAWPRVFPARAGREGPAYTTVKVQRGDIQATVAASGQLQPSSITTIRPDSNMPTRKLVAIYVTEGQAVRAGQALAAIDGSGLDLDLASATANLASQRAKLANLEARPADLDRTQADGDLAQAKATLDAAQEGYDSAKLLSDRDLVAKSQLSDAERQLAVAKLRYANAQLSWANVHAQSQTDVLQAQEAAVAQAQSDLQKSQLIFDSATIRTPVAGVVAELTVNVGDLVAPATALMTVVNPDPMILEALVNENDMVMVRLGQSATITPSGYPDLRIAGRVTQIDLHAQVQSNVSVFQTAIEVPNHERSLLWGMNADAEIAVLSLGGVLTLPNGAIKTSNGSSQVSILDEGKVTAWDIQAGPSDGTRTEVLAGLDEGEEVLILPRQSTAAAQRGAPTGGGMNQVFRTLGR
jgi:HlyD family secretion protein